MKRKIFLESFLGALGAVRIIWGDFFNNKVYGTVIYDESDPEERQDFVWHMTEENIPSEDVKNLIDFLSTNNLIDIDKIIAPIDELKLDFIDQSKRKEVFDELFNLHVRMIDNGEETDSYFIHD